MKSIALATLAVLFTSAALGQTDTTLNKTDTIHVGNFIIIKKNKGNVDTGYTSRHHYDFDINIGSSRRRHTSNISTNWFIFDLGFANLHDKTNYSSPEAINFLQGTPAFTKEDLKLKTSKSSNVNIWLFMQKINITKHVLNLKYGLGLEMFNYRYENNITYNKNPVFIYRDTVDFSKNKLYAGYATIPFMLNINTAPNKRYGFSISAGISAGYRVGTHTKQISDERGKVKVHDDF